MISDGAFAGAEDFARQAAHLRFIKVDGGRDNVGIVGFEVRRHPNRSSQYEVMVHVKLHRESDSRALTVTLGETALVRESIDIEPEGRRVLIYPFKDLAGTWLRVWKSTTTLPQTIEPIWR